MLKPVKWIVLGGVGAVLVGGLVFGREFKSYVNSSVSAVREEVKNNVPIEFELRRAKDMLDTIMPELQANVRLIAQEEVALANLTGEIDKARNAVSEQRIVVSKLRDVLDLQQTSYTLGGRKMDRQTVLTELSRKADRLAEAEATVGAKEKLLESRKVSLQAAIDALAKSKDQRALLEQRIAALESQWRLIQAADVGNNKVNIDNSALAQTEKLLEQIKNRLDVSERVLARQAEFIDNGISFDDSIDEEAVLNKVDAVLGDDRDDERPLARME